MGFSARPVRLLVGSPLIIGCSPRYNASFPFDRDRPAGIGHAGVTLLAAAGAVRSHTPLRSAWDDSTRRRLPGIGCRQRSGGGFSMAAYWHPPCPRYLFPNGHGLPLLASPHRPGAQRGVQRSPEFYTRRALEVSVLGRLRLQGNGCAAARDPETASGRVSTKRSWSQGETHRC